MVHKIMVAVLALFLLTTSHHIMASKGASHLQIQTPATLTKDGGYDNRQALFGPLPLYDQSIVQNVYYADSELCNSVDTRKGYPIRPKDSSGKMEPWQSPYILMVDRGSCTFIQQVRNAQRSGALAVIIADNTCLCDIPEETLCTQDTPWDECETSVPILADDGSGSDITIPSILMFKQDADLVKAEVMANNAVTMEISWSLPSPEEDVVEYEIWMSPMDNASLNFLQDFMPVALALGKRAHFTPQMYFANGKNQGCRGYDGQNVCYNFCTNSGRYCAMDPDGDSDVGLSGADVIKESLRWICIWYNYGKDGVGGPWWEYVTEFNARCDIDEGFVNNQCTNEAMEHANIDGSLIGQCMEEWGGLDGDVPNSFLEGQLLTMTKEKIGSTIIPSVHVNQIPLPRHVDVPSVLKAICAGFVSKIIPSVCNKENRPTGGTTKSKTTTNMPTKENSTSPMPSIPKLSSNESTSSPSPTELPETKTPTNVPTMENSTSPMPSIPKLPSNESTSSPSPTEMPANFTQYDIPTFLVAIELTNENDNKSGLFLDEMEELVSDFLAEIFNNATQTDGSVYIPALELTTANLTNLASRFNQTDGWIVIRVDGIIGIQDGIFNATKIIDYLIPSTMILAFQSEDIFGNLLQSSSNPILKSVAAAELCPDSFDGSNCKLLIEDQQPSLDGSYSLENSSTSSNIAFDAGDYAILAILVIGLLSTVLTIYYKLKNKNGAQNEGNRRPYGWTRLDGVAV